jgi:hypothetical protein
MDRKREVNELSGQEKREVGWIMLRLEKEVDGSQAPGG